MIQSARSASHLIWLILCFALVKPGPASADSHGYFCLGRGYVAYQFGMAGPPVAPHRLYIVRYGGGAISEPTVFLLPQFQVHAMRCRAGAVDIAAIDSIHTVTLNSLGIPIAASAVPLAERGRIPQWGPSRNLAGLSQAARTLTPERHPLHVEANGHAYVLEITAAPDSIRECPPTITARVAELDLARRAVRVRVLFHGTDGPKCAPADLAPTAGAARPLRDASGVLLDALVFGVRDQVDLSAYTGDLRMEFEQYLRRSNAYRTTRPPAGGAEAQMVDAARVGYERRLVAAARDTGVTAIAVAYVDSLRPCYEWEGFHDCPERDALFADKYQAAHPDGPFSAFLPLLAAHRWLCAAEAFEYEKRPVDATRSRHIHSERLAIARSSKVLLIRTAAEYLAQRGRCFAPANR